MEAVTVIGITPVKRPSLEEWLTAARKREKPLEELISDINTGAISDTEAYNALTFMKETGRYQGVEMGCFVIPLAGVLGAALGGLIYDNTLTMALGAAAGVAGGVAASYRLTTKNLNGEFLPVATGHVDSLIAYLERTDFSNKLVRGERHTIIPFTSWHDLLPTTHLVRNQYCKQQPRRIPFGELAISGTPKIIYEDFYEIGEGDSHLSVRVITDRRPFASVRAVQDVGTIPTYVLPTVNNMRQMDTHCDIYEQTTFTRPLQFERTSFEMYSRIVKPYFIFQTA